MTPRRADKPMMEISMPEPARERGAAAPPRILVVEDEKVVALDIRAMLKRLGYGLSGTAVSAEEALAACRADPPDLVLMDIFLEGPVDGIEAGARIQSELDLPVVFLTAHGDRVTLERAKRTAPHGYVVKPVDERWLNSSIEVALSKHKAERALKKSEERFRLLFEGMLSAFVVFEVLRGDAGQIDDFRFLEVNPAFERVTGLGIEDVEGRTLREVLPGIEPHWINILRDVALNRRPERFEAYMADLNQYFLAQAQSPAPGQVAVALEDITERKRGAELLRYRTFHDVLTELPNRALCLDRIHRAIERARRRTNYVYAVLFLDIDRFKLINDSLGHVAGDAVLRMVAEALRGQVRALDTVARVGGDEFAVLLEEISTPADALRIVRKIRDRFKTPFSFEERGLSLSVSMGAVLGPADYEQAEELLQNAAIAMSEARKTGPGRLRIFEWSMRERAERIMDLETSLREGLERDEFIVHYQPIFVLGDMSLAGFEALARWRRPDGRLVAPGEFIPVAEESGLIIPLGEVILRKACRTVGRLDEVAAGAKPLFMSVNLSARQFSRPDLVKQVVRATRDMDIDPGRLKLEITESVVMDNIESAMLKLRGLRELGARIAIDDFGTGYSSLASLQRFPLDTLKIDRGFVSAMHEPGNLAIVKAVIALAHGLDFDVVAEGVETPEHTAKLAELGCDYGQGFYFSRPLEEGAALDLARRFAQTDPSSAMP